MPSDVGNPVGPGVGDAAGRLQAALERANPRLLRDGKPDAPGDAQAVEPVSVAGKKRRYDFLRTCIRLGLNAYQISLLSLSSPDALRSNQHVYQQIDSLGLNRLYTSRVTARRRKGFHNETVIKLFMKLYGQALEAGYDVTDVLRDEVPFEGVRFRPDLGLRIGKRLFLVEVQLSRIEFTRWRTKLQQYLSLYRRVRVPFRALFLLDRAEDVVKVREYAREVLADNPKLILFLFMTLGDFQRQWDVLHQPCWEWAWTPRRLHRLM